jgi:signal transduction histidine kinase
VGRLAAGVAHELGTPLNIVAGRAKMLRRGDVEPTATKEFLATISEQAERMTTIIQQLMDFARRREPKIIKTDLLNVARASSRLVEPLARRRGLTVRVTSAEPTSACGDPAQLEQVVSNLLVNAMQACNDDGHVEVSCGINVSQGGDGASFAFIRVVDNGHGMDATTIERIFEPFFTTKDLGQGTGLGLSVAHGIVQEHGGTIVVESAPGQGSSFTVLIPREMA